MRECDEVREALVELARTPREPLAALLETHAAQCADCGKAVAGARALGARLAAWADPEPPEGLVARTLARVRLAEAMAPREPGSQRIAKVTTMPAAAMPPAAPIAPELARAHARRSSVELFAMWDLSGPRPPLEVQTPRKLGVRIAIQAAAAVVLFALCTGFTVTFYPVVVSALEESRLQTCQEHLARVGSALRRYRSEHRDAAQDPKSDYALRDALVRGGYARDEDFTCPAARDGGVLGFFLKLPDASGDGRAVIGYDHLGNHAASLNVLSADGKVEHIEADRLGERLAPR